MTTNVSPLVSDPTMDGGRACPLRARYVGILCDDPGSPEVAALQREVSELGARVALVRAGVDDEGRRDTLGQMARVLSQLYDAVVCVGLEKRVVRELRDASGIPVIANAGAGESPIDEQHAGLVEPAGIVLKALLTSLRA